MKYRYFMGGTFSPEAYENIYENTTPGFLNIDIPAPFTRDSEEEAMQDQGYAYRFVSDGENVLIAVYPTEAFNPAVDDKGRKCLNIWTEGAPFHFYTYEEFVSLGGLLYELPDTLCFPSKEETEEDLLKELEDILSSPAPTWDVEDYKIGTTFNALFPSLKKGDRPVYIDNEAYHIAEVTVGEED